MRYSEPHRHYHNFDHLGKMLAWLDRVSPGNDVIELAIWYHDCIYEPLEKDNEAQSARHFREQLGSFLDDAIVDNVERLVMATDPRLPRSGEADEDLLVDIDLSILGSAPVEYENYRQAVRREYAMVSDEDFRLGRKAVLEGLLAQQLYVTESFRSLQTQAEENISKELFDIAEEDGAIPGINLTGEELEQFKHWLENSPEISKRDRADQLALFRDARRAGEV
ncbi:hypothetical protein N9A94_04040 [Akkermansiaceae bacterium]|nr:hypothetical protein [Akkermansiaceae bacterium]